MKHIKRFLVIIIIAALVCAGVFSYFKIETVIYPLDYSDQVFEYSAANDLDEEFVLAVIKCESSFNPKAVSSVGAIGLMQLTPETFEWVQSKKDGSSNYESADLYSPQINIKYGCYLLRLHLDEFGDKKTALAAYHAGRGNVNKWLKNKDYSSNGKTLDTTPYKETNAYMERVMSVYEKYQKLLKNQITRYIYGL